MAKPNGNDSCDIDSPLPVLDHIPLRNVSLVSSALDDHSPPPGRSIPHCKLPSADKPDQRYNYFYFGIPAKEFERTHNSFDFGIPLQQEYEGSSPAIDIELSDTPCKAFGVEGMVKESTT